MKVEILSEDLVKKIKEKSNFVLLDVREQEEWNLGFISGALHLPLTRLGKEAEKVLFDKSLTVVTYCAVGARSLIAAQLLKKIGYSHVVSLQDGIHGWQEKGFPIESSSTLSKEERTQYRRHLNMPEVGEEGQKKLLQSKVLIVGVGGLGSPAAYYLAAAGVGTLGIIDFDRVDRSNLQRQILYTANQVGELKVDSAKKTLEKFNPLLKIQTYSEKLTNQNADKIFENYDLIIDGSDNFETRYVINDAAFLLKKPYVHGSVYRFEGEVTVFYPGKGPCYRCLYPELPPPEIAPSCAEAGVLGVLPGIIGILQATEAIKIILGKGNLLVGRTLSFNALQGKFYEMETMNILKCPLCG